ncbi:MAG: aspartate carbamoyltransferase regulatory subunit, partial [Clostridia bacterium]|nr:aspartate carbamoyltransferase regulatory subunit [Clostridia bacterium]
GNTVEKKTIDLPESLTNVLHCKNPRCISTTEQELPQIFKLADKEKRIYRCLYCETKAKY